MHKVSWTVHVRPGRFPDYCPISQKDAAKATNHPLQPLISTASTQKYFVISAWQSHKNMVVKISVVFLVGITLQLNEEFPLASAGLSQTWLAVSEVHDVHSRLMPPVKHNHHEYVPHLVAGTQVVQLTWKERKETYCSKSNVQYVLIVAM